MLIFGLSNCTRTNLGHDYQKASHIRGGMGNLGMGNTGNMGIGCGYWVWVLGMGFRYWNWVYGIVSKLQNLKLD